MPINQKVNLQQLYIFKHACTIKQKLNLQPLYTHLSMHMQTTFVDMIRVYKRRIFQVQWVQLINKHCQEFNQNNRTEFQGT